MTENARHWKSTTTGRKNMPIVAEKPVKKKRDDKGRYIKKEK
tara:strand:+ start:2019 stop:2144 length:126 start_codon:yes stop_codon:yes gene_type:complete